MSFLEIYLWGCAISTYLGLKFIIMSYSKDDILLNFDLLEDSGFWKYCWLPIVPEVIGLFIIACNLIEKGLTEIRKRFYS